MPVNTRTVALKNGVTEIERLSTIFQAFCSKNGVIGDTIYPIDVVLDEMITNVISYGYDDDGSEHQILVRLKIENSILSAEIEDDGKPFNPLEKEDVDTNTSVEEKPIGGLGIHLVKHYMDESHYKRENGKNLFMMRKKVSLE